MPAPNRYLVRFEPKRTPHYFTDVLVIGAGIAGLRAALEIPESLDVLVVSKEQVRESNSAYAQGGIAGVMSPEDAFENHVEDTINAGGGLCDAAIVDKAVHEAPEQIETLIRWGANFDEEGGKIALTREGGHSHRRIVHALGDATMVPKSCGPSERRRSTRKPFRRGRTALRSISPPRRPMRRRHHLRPGQGKILVGEADDPCPGGAGGRVHRETTNPPVATGDGMAAAYRAGAELRDMEFMQLIRPCRASPAPVDSSSAKRFAARGVSPRCRQMNRLRARRRSSARRTRSATSLPRAISRTLNAPSIRMFT
ncbi:MAG: FAD-binding protein [Gemmataceae bacterium]